eukprot:jgi/Psemu1/44856/gm1.44856_g
MMSKEGGFTAQHKLPPKYKNDNHFKQDWCVGIYTMQLMTNHCPEWVEFPIFATRDTKHMEASAAGSDIQLAQSWESPSTINSKATSCCNGNNRPRRALSCGSSCGYGREKRRRGTQLTPTC